jgi:DNA-binding response OmpR family regulator
MEATTAQNFSPVQFKRILIVDDDAEMRGLIARKLTVAGFETSEAHSALRALELIEQKGLPHLAVVDINMPGMSGLEFCQNVQQYADLPVIMVTAVNESATTIKAIELYAEDYIVKPFNLDELVARIQRVLRRIGDFSYSSGPVVAIDGRLGINFAQKQIVSQSGTVEMTPTESKVFYILWRNQGRVVTHDYLLGRIWPGQEMYEETLRVHVHRLRHKLEKATQRKYILTERGQGYRFIIHADRTTSKSRAANNKGAADE